MQFPNIPEWLPSEIFGTVTAHSLTLDGKGGCVPALNYGPRGEGVWGLEVSCTEQVNGR